jgi:hypothetical protein
MIREYGLIDTPESVFFLFSFAIKWRNRFNAHFQARDKARGIAEGNRRKTINDGHKHMVDQLRVAFDLLGGKQWMKNRCLVRSGEAGIGSVVALSDEDVNEENHQPWTPLEPRLIIPISPSPLKRTVYRSSPLKNITFSPVPKKKRAQHSSHSLTLRGTATATPTTRPPPPHPRCGQGRGASKRAVRWEPLAAVSGHGLCHNLHVQRFCQHQHIPEHQSYPGEPHRLTRRDTGPARTPAG